MIEAALAVVLALSGFGALLPLHPGVPRAALGWMAFPVGASVYMMAAAGMLAVGGRIEAMAVVAVTALVGSIGFVVALRRGGVDRSLAAPAGWLVAGSVAVAALVWFVPLTRLTLDSVEYLLGAHQIQSEGAGDLMAPFLLKRQMGLQALHALAVSDLRAHAAFVGPLFGTTGVGFFTWFVWTHLGGPRRWRLAVVGGAVVFLLSSHRFPYDFFYVHPHIQIATLLLIAVAAAWKVVLHDEDGWAFPAGLCLAAILLMRPEAPLLVAVVLVAFAATGAGTVARHLMAIPALTLMGVWYGMVLWRHAPDGRAIGVTDPVFSSIVVVVVAASLVLVLERDRLPRLNRLAGVALVPALLGVLVLFTVSDPLILRDSVVATFRNFKRLGWWVTTWAVAVPLLSVALLTHRVRLGELWTRTIVGFGLLFFTFPYLRGSPWRVGPGDSGNRMVAHFLLVVLAFILLAVADESGDATDGRSPGRLPETPTAG